MTDDDADDFDSDEPPPELAPAPPMRDTQFRLASFFIFTAVCGAYFFLEKRHHGEFGWHALGAVALVVGIALPALWFVFWLLWMFLDGRGPLGMILMMAAIAGALALALTRFWG